MAIPHRGITSQSTYFVTASTWRKLPLFQTERNACLFLDLLFKYRKEGRYLLHAFVLMPDHFHIILTPAATCTLERSLQFIKGGFSFRAKRELQLNCEIWQTSFHDRRIRDLNEYVTLHDYLANNPVKRGLAENPSHYPYSSANKIFDLESDPMPLRLTMQ